VLMLKWGSRDKKEDQSHQAETPVLGSTVNRTALARILPNYGSAAPLAVLLQAIQPSLQIGLARTLVERAKSCQRTQRRVGVLCTPDGARPCLSAWYTERAGSAVGQYGGRGSTRTVATARPRVTSSRTRMRQACRFTLKSSLNATASKQTSPWRRLV